jgi:dihydroorotate dehydrogenase
MEKRTEGERVVLEMSQEEYYELTDVDLETPLINAAGSINGTNPEKIIREVETLSDTAIGAITVGSFTVPRQEGNAVNYGEPVYYHDQKAGLTYNSMGLPNIGLDAAVQLAPRIFEAADDKYVIFSVSPTKSEEHGTSVEQSVRLVYELFDKAKADLVELNVSCPNVVTEGGGRKPIMGYDLETMQELVDALHLEVGEGRRLGVKLPPYISDDEKLMVPELGKILRGRRVFRFLVSSNTIPNQRPVDEDDVPILSVEIGGMSGPGTAQVGLEQELLWLPEKGEMDLVSSLGVHNGQELASRVKRGAVAGEGVTFLWESTNWKKAITNMLAGFADEMVLNS